MLKERNDKKFQLFMRALVVLGLETEEESFSVDSDVKFVKIHASQEFVHTYASLFDVEINCDNFEYRPYAHPPRKFMATPLTRPNVNDPIYSRAPESIGGDIPKTVTSAERIMVVSHILNRAIWGAETGEYGVTKLMKANVLLDAFPLHDGDYKWTESGPLNDRQLLALYWGSFDCWYKAQPLNLIEKYFGTEYAIYFAWLGLYNKHLIPAAIFSIFVLLYGVITMFTSLNGHRCHFAECPMEYLSNSCYMANMSYIFDNWCAVIFCAVMTLWATIFMELWQREEAVLQLQWNLKSVKHTITLRPEYLEVATKKKYSPITDKMEPYIPKAQTACRYTLTLASVTLLLIVMILVTFGVMIYRVAVNVILIKSKKMMIIKNKYRGMIASITGGIMSGVFIFVFKWIYEDIARVLTNMENHRTQLSFKNAYIYKSFALAFANNYSAVFYVAFFKGKFFTYPGDLALLSYLGGINTDVCDPTGCIVDLAILLIIIMVIKALVSNVTQVLVPKLFKRFNETMHRVRSQDVIPQWENEYLLAKTEEFFMVGEYMDMIIQYGFVNFFIMGFPLAPALALLNNIVELRVDASKVTKSYRRPIPVRVAGLGAWFGLLQATTYIGVVTNALVLAFTSTFMEKVLSQMSYSYYGNDGRDAFISQTLSVFNMSDFDVLDGESIHEKLNLSQLCYYPGKRYPAWHTQKYQRRKEYWYHLAIKFGVVVIFEHVLVVLKGFLAYAIPDVPFSVRQQIAHQEKLQKRLVMTEIHQKYLKQHKYHIKEGTIT